MVTNAYKLVQRSATANNSPVADDAVTGYTGVTGENAVVTHLALVAAVAVNQEKVMAADDSLGLRCGRTVDVAILTEDVVITHFKIGGFTLVLEVLRLEANHREGEELVTLAESGGATEYNVVVQYTTCSQFNMRANYAIRPYYNVLCQFGGRINNCCRMNLSHVSILTLIPCFIKQKMKNL